MTSFTTMAAGAFGGDARASLPPLRDVRPVGRAELVAQVDSLEQELAELRRTRDEEQAETERLAGRLHRLLKANAARQTLPRGPSWVELWTNKIPQNSLRLAKTQCGVPERST